MSTKTKQSKTTTTTSAPPPQPKFEIAFAPEAWDRWWQYCYLTQGEVGAFMYVTIDKDLKLAVVDDLFLVPQEASAAEVDFMAEGLPYAIEKAASEDRLADLRGCIHSHGEMSTFWSGTDEDMIRKMGLTTDWFVSCVTNRKGSFRGRIDVFDFEPLGKFHIKFDELFMYRYTPADEEERAKSELAQFVQKPKPVTTYGYYGSNAKGIRMGQYMTKLPAGWTDEGDDIWSHVEKGAIIYVDRTTGFELGVVRLDEDDEDEKDLKQMGLITEGDEDAKSDLGGRLRKIGEDWIVCWSDGKPCEDKFGAYITDDDILTWPDLKDLVHKDDWETTLPYITKVKEDLEAVLYNEVSA